MPIVKCDHCSTSFEKNQYQINRSKKHFCCPECRWAAQRKTEEHKKDVRRKNNQKWSKQNRDKRNEYNRQYIADHREELNKKNRERYAENRDEQLARRKELYQENIEFNRAKNNKRQVEWTKKNPEKRLAQAIRHRNKPGHALKQRLRQVQKHAEKYGCYIGDADEIKCFYEHVSTIKRTSCYYCKEECGTEVAKYKKDATVDHKIPLCRKGDHDRTNLVVACRECNSTKCSKTAEEFFEYLKQISIVMNNSG